MLVAALHLSSYDLVRQPILTDVGYYLHFARRVAAGATPYLDFLDYKTPLSSFAGALFLELGRAVGLDAVLAVRLGYLAVGALTAGLAARLAAHAAGGRASAAWLFLAAFAGLDLLGRMPSIGNVPKALVLLAAAAGLTAVRRRRFLLAGACVALAGLDWQPGGLLLLVAVLAALPAGGRARALGAAVLGALAAGLPFVLFFAVRGGLGAFWEQCVAVPFGKSDAAAGVTSESFWRRVGRVKLGLAGQGPLALALGALALPGLVLLVRRARATPRADRAFLRGLVTWHAAVLAWTLYDFQGMADLYFLEASLAFLSGAALAEGYALLETALPLRAARVLPWGAALVALLLVRPSFLAGGLRWVGEPDQATAYDIEDQREAAAAFARACAGKKVACLARHELLVLGELDDAAGIVFWHYAVHAYRGLPGEESAQTLERLLDEEGVEVLVLNDPRNRTGAEEDPRRGARAGLNRVRLSWLVDTMRWVQANFARRSFASEDGSYEVQAWVRGA